MKQHILPCFVHSTSSILLSNGKGKVASEITRGEKVIDHNGRSRRILNMKTSPCSNVSYIAIHSNKTQKLHGFPKFNHLYLDNNTWSPLHHMDNPKVVKNVLPSYDLSESFDLFWPMGFVKVDGKYERRMQKLEHVYEFGFLLAIFMTMGVIDETHLNMTEYICDSKNIYLLEKIRSCLQKVGIKGKYIHQSNTEPYHYTRIRVLSPNLHHIHESILVDNRSLPSNLTSLDEKYMKGLYDGIIEGNQHFYNKQTHDLAVFASNRIFGVGESRLIVQKVEGFDAADLNRQNCKSSILFTDTDSAFSSVICDGIPTCTFPF